MSQHTVSTSHSTASSTAYGITPYKLTLRTGTLSFACTGTDPRDEKSWQILHGLNGKPRQDNVGPVRFRFGLAVTQGSEEVLYTAKWKHTNLVNATINPMENGRILLQFECKGDGMFDTKGPEEEANQIPLARYHKLFRYVRLSLKSTGIDPTGGTEKYSLAALMDHVRIHLSSDRDVAVKINANQPGQGGEPGNRRHKSDDETGQDDILEAPETNSTDEELQKSLKAVRIEIDQAQNEFAEDMRTLGRFMREQAMAQKKAIATHKRLLGLKDMEKAMEEDESRLQTQAAVVSELSAFQPQDFSSQASGPALMGRQEGMDLDDASVSSGERHMREFEEMWDS